MTKPIFTDLLAQGIMVIIISERKPFDFDVEVTFNRPVKPKDNSIFLTEIGKRRDQDHLVEKTLQYMKKEKLILTALV